MTPAQARIEGSDYIVVGHPITQADNAVEAYHRCKKRITNAVKIIPFIFDMIIMWI